MAKYGRKNVISRDLSDYIIGILGESGIGKTTLLFKVCEKLFGEDGYMFFDMGKEVGTTCINGIVAEPIETYKKFLDVTKDIMDNKEKDYPNLKVIILDTVDQLYNIGEPYLTKLYNQENIGVKDFKPAKSINSVEGGFGKGMDRLIDMVLDRIFQLKAKGVGVWYTGHTKTRSNDDVFTGETYDMLTTSISQRYFNSIKDKTHVLGIAYIDRTITTEELERENIVTHKKETRKRVTSENRKIKFRDDNYVADGKSRLADIVDEIDLDVNEFIQAIEDAIESEASKGSGTTAKKTSTKKKTPKVEEPVEEEIEEVVENIVDEAPFDLEDEIGTDIFGDEAEEEAIAPVDKAALTVIRGAYKEADAKAKAEVKEILGNYGGKLANEMRPSDVNKIMEILDI